MIHLQPNVSGQTAYFSPFQARKFMASFTDYLLVFRNVATDTTFACVMNVFADNARYTQVDISTNAADGVNGNVLMKESGLYTYTIYGQNSSTNLDPTDAVVVGVCEKGTAQLSDDAAWTTPNISIPDNIIYYE
jgi:hypothetical protein